LAIARRAAPNSDATYRTQSIWRYFSELDYRRRLPGRQQPPGIADGLVDVHYGYLAYLLSRQPAPRDCRTNDNRCPEEIEWLNASLLAYQRFQQSLRRLYPQFVISLAAYGEDGGRASHDPRATGIGSAYWRDRTLGGCAYLTIRATNGETEGRVAREKLRFRGITARCLVVRAEGFRSEFGAVMGVRASDAERLNQVIFGIAGDVRSATPVIVGEDRATGATHTSWPIRLSSNHDNVFVFTNVNMLPQATLDHDLDVTITAPGSDTSASRESVPTSGGASPPEAPTGELRDDMDGRMERAAPRLTADGPVATGLQRRPGRNEMRVTLRIIPDALNVALEVNGGTGGLEQVLAFGIASGAITASDPVVAAAHRRAAEIDGASIALSFPLIDYGFTGAFDEAEVHFSRAEGHRLEALGPTDSDPGPRRDMRASGHVTIEEYSPAVLRGSFTAELVDPTEDLRGVQPSYAVVRSVEGRFVVASPWREDERLEVGPSASMEFDAMEDMVTIVPGLTPGMNVPGLPTLPQPGSDGSGPSSSSSSSSSVWATPGGCDCSCEAFDRVQEVSDQMSASGRQPSAEEQRIIMCSMQCMNAFAACARR